MGGAKPTSKLWQHAAVLMSDCCHGIDVFRWCSCVDASRADVMSSYAAVYYHTYVNLFHTISIVDFKSTPDQYLPRVTWIWYKRLRLVTFSHLPAVSQEVHVLLRFGTTTKHICCHSSTLLASFCVYFFLCLGWSGQRVRQRGIQG